MSVAVAARAETESAGWRCPEPDAFGRCPLQGSEERVPCAGRTVLALSSGQLYRWRMKADSTACIASAIAVETGSLRVL